MKKDMDYIDYNGIIAIMRGIPVDQLCDITQAIYDGGIRIVECTVEHNKENPEDLLQKKLSVLSENFGDKMMIGAGTVLTTKQVDVTKKSGGKLIVTPNTNKEIIKYASDSGLITVIGALTPSEIVTAHDCGADYIKVFPASDLGPGYIKSIKAPLSHIKLLAVGGISISNMEDFIKAGVCGFGIGSPLMPKKAIEEHNYDYIKKLAEDYVCTYKKFI